SGILFPANSNTSGCPNAYGVGRRRYSARDAARDRNRPATKHQSIYRELQRSPIAKIITRFAGDRQHLAFTVGTGSPRHHPPALHMLGFGTLRRGSRPLGG